MAIWLLPSPGNGNSNHFITPASAKAANLCITPEASAALSADHTAICGPKFASG
jgi:hypothetical protein